MTRVSSQAIRSTPASVSSARRVMSPRLPIGVATRCRPGNRPWRGQDVAADGKCPGAGPVRLSAPYLELAFGRIMSI